MRTIFHYHFRPSPKELEKLWEDSTFIIDANVLLNLYRYSEATRNQLEKAISGVQDRIFITNQAANEFFKNRLTVTSEQSKKYSETIKTINQLIENISSKDRHPFVEDSKLENFTLLSKDIIKNLEDKQEELLKKLTDDVILTFIQKTFEGKTGVAWEEDRSLEVIDEGKRRYESKIPPGYKDSEKDFLDDPLRKYGDLVVWLQSIEYAKEKKTSVLFITDDKKEDWWLEQAGRTIGPRPELIKEFKQKTEHSFWMYSVGNFLKESAKRSKQEVSQEILEEIASIREQVQQTNEKETRDINNIVQERSIIVNQDIDYCNENEAAGELFVTLTRDMPYATGSGKFFQKLNSIPKLEVNLISEPEGANQKFNISYGCGTNKDFNVHLKSKNGQLLPAGEYIFKYAAICDESL